MDFIIRKLSLIGHISRFQEDGNGQNFHDVISASREKLFPFLERGGTILGGLSPCNLGVSEQTNHSMENCVISVYSSFFNGGMATNYVIAGEKQNVDKISVGLENELNKYGYGHLRFRDSEEKFLL